VGQTKTYTLRTLKKNETPPSPEKVKITDKNDVFTVDTGRIRYEIPIYSGSILSNIQRRDDTGNWVTVSTKGLEAIIWRTGIKKFKSRVEEQGIRVLKNGKLVLDPKSDYMVKAIRANPKFKAKPQKRY